MLMRYFLIILLFAGLFSGNSYARGKKHKYRGLPRDEVGLMNNVVGCLANKDSISYFYLFPPFDTLWALVMHNPDHSPETIKALNKLKDHPQSLLEFDPAYNRKIMAGFYNVIKKGEDSGIHWKSVAIQRYELYKEEGTLQLSGYEKIAPERFKGYLFLRDILGRLTFCITISEIQKIQGYYFGGQLQNIIEASTIDQFFAKEKEEQKYFDWLARHPESDPTLLDSTIKAKADSLKQGDTGANKIDILNIIIPDEEGTQTRKEVVDRKYYEGKFDDEIPVKLFVRYMKDPKSGNKVAYDGLYKFGDQKEYVKLTIIINPEGKWIMDDELPLGSMELDLKNRVYTGTWLNNESQTGYDVVLTQTVIQPRKLEQLENILEKGLSGRVDEASYETKDDKKKKVVEEKAKAAMAPKDISGKLTKKPATVADSINKAKTDSTNKSIESETKRQKRKRERAREKENEDAKTNDKVIDKDADKKADEDADDTEKPAKKKKKDDED